MFYIWGEEVCIEVMDIDVYVGVWLQYVCGDEFECECGGG